MTKHFSSPTCFFTICQSNLIGAGCKVHSQIFLSLLFIILVTIPHASSQSLPYLKINDDITVQGVSSGAAMAIQMHVAYSKIFKGVGALAGPPYWCAMSNLELALTSCENKPWLIDVSLLWDGVTAAAAIGSIDDPSHITHDRVWLFSGTLDTVVDTGVVKKALMFYQHYMSSDNDLFIGNISAAHAWITADYGNKCDYFGSPYINNCNFDAVESMLHHFYPNMELNPRAKTINGSNIFSFDQNQYTPLNVDPSVLSMGDKGFIYIPTNCHTQACGLNVAFHGCEQGFDLIGMDFILHNGLNQWAESNNMVVLYPQATTSAYVPYNPMGCWDWWGYTGIDYASQLGPQMATVRSMMNAIMGK